MKTSYDLAKMFHNQFISKGKKNGSRLSPKQADWLRSLYIKDNPEYEVRNGKYMLIFNKANLNKNTVKTHYRLNGDNSLYLVNEGE